MNEKERQREMLIELKYNRNRIYYIKYNNSLLYNIICN